ncbi:uncharacterized protein DUF4174 [Chromatocurvus halotolerans]|uniref:Uncharacterized protein DUF4174 n=3 Tax=Chromatocurvus halotolerans TaxID=1132028 RepID=A0A4R2KX94_9GAMM|nr:uncharacterized protein DUF4174 [Chromatocurvus halotolerans]
MGIRGIPMHRGTCSVMLALALITSTMSSAEQSGSLASGFEALSLRNLSDLRWKNRVIIVLSSGSASVAEDIAALKEHTPGLEERDAVWFVLDGEVLVTNFPGAVAPTFADDLGESVSGDQRVLLIGKDGGVKMRASRLNIDELFSRIDAMPMRRREMQSPARETSEVPRQGHAGDARMRYPYCAGWRLWRRLDPTRHQRDRSRVFRSGNGSSDPSTSAPECTWSAGTRRHQSAA